MNHNVKNIQFIDLAAQQKAICSNLQNRISAVMSHGKYIMGPEVSELEEKLAAFTGAKHAISCSSGTDALLMALMAYGIGPGDAVFTSPFTFIATAETIALLGATPVYVDIDAKTFNLDPSKLETAIAALKENDSTAYPLPQTGGQPNESNQEQLRPRGIIGVDLFGLPADYNSINAIAKKHGLFVIEDAAQSFGALYHEKKAGCLSDIAATSFFPAKPLGGYGDGGAVFTNDDDLADKIQSIRVHGKGKDKYDNVRVGINGRLDTIQAAVLLEKLSIFPDEIKQRNRAADQYAKALKDLVVTPFVPEESTCVWAQYSVISNSREQILSALRQAGIPTAIYYPKPLHQQSAFAYLGYNTGDFPVSEKTSQNIFSLPMHPYLENAVIQFIADNIRSVLADS